MAIRQDVATGIAAEALGWVQPNRLIAGLQGGEVVVVDTPSGHILHRERLPVPLRAHTSRHYAHRTPGGLAILLNSHDGKTPPLVALAEATGNVRSVRLEDSAAVGARASLAFRHSAGMAVDIPQERAIVAGSETSVAEINLKVMSVRYHRMPRRLALDTRCPPTAGDCSSARAATWLGNDRIAIFGTDSVVSGDDGTAGSKTSVRPAGVAVLDTRSWNGWLVPGASEVAAAGDRALMYGGALGPVRDEGIGLRAYRPDGRMLFHVFGSELVWSVELAGDYAYARSDEGTRVIALSSGEVMRKLPAAQQPFYFLPTCTAEGRNG